MRYGDVLIAPNSKLAEIDGWIETIGVEKSMQKTTLRDMTFEEYSNEQMMGPDSNEWFGMTEAECKEAWKREMDERAEALERSQDRIEEARAEIKKLLEGMDLATVNHYLNARQKTYEQEKLKAEVPLYRIDAQAQIEATIAGKNIVKALEAAKSKQ